MKYVLKSKTNTEILSINSQKYKEKYSPKCTHIELSPFLVASFIFAILYLDELIRIRIGLI